MYWITEIIFWVFIALWAMFCLINSAFTFSGTNEVYPSRYSKRTTWLAILSTFSDTLAFSALVFLPDSPWTTDSSASSATIPFKLTLVDIPSTFLVVFWIFSALVLLVFVSNYCISICAEDEGPMDNIITGVKTFIFDTFSMAILNKWVAVYVCRYPDNADPTLVADPTVVCGSGMHIAMIVVATILLIIYYVFYGVHLMTQDFKSDQIHYFRGFYPIMLQIRMIQAIMNHFVFEEPWAVLPVLFVTNVFIAVWIGRKLEDSCTSKPVAYARVYGTIFAAFACIVSMIAEATQTALVPLILFYVGFVIYIGISLFKLIPLVNENSK